VAEAPGGDSCLARAMTLSLRRRWVVMPSFLARDLAYRSPQALQRSFFPLGPFLHSGLVVTLQLEQRDMPAGGFPEARPLPAECSLTLPGGLERREPRGGGTVSIVPEDA